MAGISRRQHLRQLGGFLGAGALAGVAPSALAADPEIPPEGLAKGIKHISYCDIGGRPDSVQVMASRNHLYVGHMFSDGLTVLDASNPRDLKPVGFFSAGQYTRTHHLQVAGDHLLLANGANIVAMQSYDTMRGYFEKALADSITNRRMFRSGLSIHDISKAAEVREIAFLEMPGFGINRLWWSGGRHAYVSAHFDGFTDHVLCVVDLNDVTKPEIVSKWWLPGMNRAAGEESRTPKGKRHALHHMITAGTAATASGATAASRFTTSRIRRTRSFSRTSTGRRRFPAARTRRFPSRDAGLRLWPTRPTPRDARRERSIPSSSTCGRQRTRCRSRPCRARASATSARSARSGRTTCMRTAPETIFATYNVAGVR